MRRILFTLLAAVLVTRCGGGSDQRSPTVPPTGVQATIDQSTPLVPPPGIRMTIPAAFPSTDKARLQQLALDKENLPDGFVLQYEDAGKNEGQGLGGIYYIAHYTNDANYQSAGSMEEFLSLRGPLNIDILVSLFDTEAISSAFFTQYASMSADDLIAYTRTQKHWPAEETTLVQIGVDASIVPFRAFGEGTFAFQTTERVRDSESAFEASFVDYSVLIKRGRVVAMVDIGALEEPAATADVESLVERLITAFR
jgi:hypothetical protein